MAWLEALASGVKVRAPFALFVESDACAVTRHFAQLDTLFESVYCAGRGRRVQFGRDLIVTCLARECDGGDITIGNYES